MAIEIILIETKELLSHLSATGIMHCVGWVTISYGAGRNFVIFGLKIKD